MPHTLSAPIDGRALASQYLRTRARSRALFELLTDEAYYERPIAQRHPIVFYEGHLPAFTFNTLLKRGLGRPPIDPAFEQLFARGIDPHEADTGNGRPATWPSRDRVLAFAAEVDRQVLDAFARADLDRPGDPLLDRGEAAYAILEHEAMHQETLLYMWHRLPHAYKRRPATYEADLTGDAPAPAWVDVPAGVATLGIDRADAPFTWDNERPATRQAVAGFAIQRDPVSNADFLAFVEAGGYQDPRWWRPVDWAWVRAEGVTHPAFWERIDHRWFWRGMFESVALPTAWPVYVSYAEAAAYARWLDARLPTEAEFQRAAYGTPDSVERRYPWGDAEPTPDRVVADFQSWEPRPLGQRPEGASAWGVRDLVGNGWTWTSSVFAPFQGFEIIPSYPEYSADFFDGEHVVLKGASPATARELIRPTFRNWFRTRYPYVYATFRCVRDAGPAATA
jgi:ergothioneine biosynthesis protein EgtB